MTDDSADVSEHAHRAELRALFEDAAAGLNPGEREVIELQLRQGLEAGEVATVLGVSRNHAHALLSRARDQLEACLGVLLVGRAGRDECGELGAMLAGWDGRLTVLLRKRVHRHIEHCATCAARRAFELRPAMLLDLSPGAAMAAGAAESFRLAFGAPPGLKAHTIALATGHGPARGGAQHRRAQPGRGLRQAGVPQAGARRPGRAARRRRRGAGAAFLAAGAGGDGRGGRGRASPSPRSPFALTGRDEHFTPSANPRPPGRRQPRRRRPPPRPRRPRPSRPRSSAAVKQPPRKPPAGQPTAPEAVGAAGTRRRAPRQTADAGEGDARPPQAPTTAEHDAGSDTDAGADQGEPEAATATTATTAASPDAGTLSVLPGGGTMIVVPGPTGSLVSLHASGGDRQLVGLRRQRPGPCRQRVPGAAGTLHAGRPGRHAEGQGQPVRALRARHQHAVPGDHDLATGRDVRRLDRLDTAVPAAAAAGRPPRR